MVCYLSLELNDITSQISTGFYYCSKNRLLVFLGLVFVELVALIKDENFKYKTVNGRLIIIFISFFYLVYACFALFLLELVSYLISTCCLIVACISACVATCLVFDIIFIQGAGDIEAVVLFIVCLLSIPLLISVLYIQKSQRIYNLIYLK